MKTFDEYLMNEASVTIDAFLDDETPAEFKTFLKSEYGITATKTKEKFHDPAIHSFKLSGAKSKLINYLNSNGYEDYIEKIK